MPKSLWVRLAGCAGAALTGWLMIRYMHQQEAIVTADTLIIFIVASLVGYVLVHTLLEHFTVAKK